MAAHGFELVPQVLPPAVRQALLAQFAGDPTPGRRGVLSLATVAEVAHSEAVVALVRPHLIAEGQNSEPRAVRAIWFDKSTEANWLVAWHQDLTVAVRKRVETRGFTAWSLKEGVPHVQPPTPLLERMLTVRLHLDDANATNGALRVIPGSHRHGRLSAEQTTALREQHPEVVCEVAAGDALLLRPLLLHASARSSRPGRRRVLHLEYAGFDLPDGLEWHEQVVG